VNSAQVAQICGDKLMTSAALARDGIPQPHNATAFTTEAALEKFGFKDDILIVIEQLAASVAEKVRLAKA